MSRLVAAIATTVSLALAAAPGAAAATEVGGTCVANDSEKDWTVLSLARTELPIPLTVPAGGVLTAWKIDVGAGQPPLEHRFQVFRPYADEFLPVAESAPVTVTEGVNVFSDRIPVQAGDRFGMHGSVETLFCDKTETDTMGYFAGAVPLGVAQKFKSSQGEGVPLRAVIEPDADGDGYGDESQDGCTGSALIQGSCPTVTLRVTRAARKRAILVQVRASSEATVKVFGQVRWRVRKKAGKRRLTVGLSAGRARTVLPGTTATFRVPLPKPVKRRLGRLTRSQALRARLTVRATDLGGRATVRRLKLKLHGRHR